MLLPALITALLSAVAFGDNACRSGSGVSSPRSAEKRAMQSSIAFKGLLTHRHRVDEASFDAEFWILEIYKGADKLAAHVGLENGGHAHLRDQ